MRTLKKLLLAIKLVSLSERQFGNIGDTKMCLPFVPTILPLGICPKYIFGLFVCIIAAASQPPPCFSSRPLEPILYKADVRILVKM